MEVMAEKEAEDFLEKEGFPVAKRKITRTEEDMLKAAKEIGYPLVLKVHSKKIIHKSDVGGVKVDVRNEEEAKKAYKEIMGIKDSEGCLVQKFVPGDWFLLGLKKDPTFNHVLAFGTGGIYTEVIKDVALRICPVSIEEIRKMIKETKGSKILEGIRGKKLNIKAVEELLLKTSSLAKKHPNIQELDINPLVVNEKEAIVVDVRMVLD
ncbi:MAG: acetate--CoA ligase family protein [Nanoarchaeota archaeon]|nr:acetate--CoA ligase family protein [Nanoarchaeota archaeon]